MIDRLSDRESLAPEEDDYMDVLAGLVELYETENDPEPTVSAADMLRHLIEAKGVNQLKVAEATGTGALRLSGSRAGEVAGWLPVVRLSG